MRWRLPHEHAIISLMTHKTLLYPRGYQIAIAWQNSAVHWTRYKMNAKLTTKKHGRSGACQGYICDESRSFETKRNAKSPFHHQEKLLVKGLRVCRREIGEGGMNTSPRDGVVRHVGGVQDGESRCP